MPGYLISEGILRLSSAQSVQSSRVFILVFSIVMNKDACLLTDSVKWLFSIAHDHYSTMTK